MSKPLRNFKMRIADGLSAWLKFEFICERGYLFSEYYLAHALGQILRAGGPDVRGEVPHPTLAVAGKTGRPPSIDFVVYDNKTPTFAVETKWAGYSNVTAGALLWDAFRLEAFHRHTGAPGLLVLGGTRERLSTLLSSVAFCRLRRAQPTTPFMPLLPLPTGPRSLVLKLDELSNAAATYVSDKIDKCSPETIATQLHAEAPQISDPDGSKAISFAVYVWEIRSC